ncbi:hypothetical protein OCU04_001292 [Sclerotinia nivalis]|uniref:NACHT domain-containing protein n=1 Tax=Sclerotinia nivalis TaxID=352851 RepID=A0A9X0AXU7_9HELO|nr:hypothetical protein OCU04_001292 [Sclerotinia nivalis]
MSFGFGIGDFLAVIELAKKLRQDFIDAPSQFKDISTEVRSLSIVLQDIDAELSVPDLNAKQTNDLKEIVFGCRDVLEKLQRILSTYGEMKSDSSGVGKKVKRIWKRLQWEPEDIKELRSRIASNVTLLNTFQGKITSKILHEIKTNADQFYERQDIRELNKESSKILDWLTPIDYAPQQHDYINQRQQGTGQWLLDSPEFKQWVESDVQKLFCPGIPGAGKTILTSIVVEELTNRFENDKSVGIAYLYCNFRRHHEQKFDDLLSSLLKQLAACQPSLPDDIINIYNKHKYGRTNPSPEEISKILQSVTALYSKVFIIVDALDECQMTDGSRERFLSELFNLQTTRQLSLFVTSRYVPEIKERFNDSLMLEIRANDQDVGRYLDGHISQLPGYVLRSSELQDEIKSEIIKAVDGMFLLARLHLQSLKGKRSPKVIRHALKRLPTGSNAYDYAYKDAMERIEGQLEDEKELAKQVLSWITCAKRPLTTTELQEAIAVEIDEPQLDKENFSEINAMISVCAGLVTVDDESDVVRLVHYTTQEYFERTHGDWFPDAETDITKTCITYLSFDNFGNGFCKRYWDFDDRVRSNQLFRYAAQNWGHHARKSSISDQTLHQAIIRFIESEAKVNASWQGLFAEKVFERYDSQLHRSRMKISRKVTAMHLAAYFGAETIVQLLLDIGEVDPNAKDGDADDDSDYDENEHNFRHRKKGPTFVRC